MYTLEIHQNVSAKLLEEIGRFRVKIWRSEGATFHNDTINQSGIWTDPVDTLAGTLHWTIRLDGQLVAAARLSIHEDVTQIPEFNLFAHTLLPSEKPIASLNRLVVDQDHRGQGLGTILDVQRITIARQSEVRMLAVEAVGRLRAEQLVRLGFGIRAVHAVDPDMSFAHARSFYALTGQPQDCGSEEQRFHRYDNEISSLISSRAINTASTTHSFKLA